MLIASWTDKMAIQSDKTQNHHQFLNKILDAEFPARHRFLQKQIQMLKWSLYNNNLNKINYVNGSLLCNGNKMPWNYFTHYIFCCCCYSIENGSDARIISLTSNVLCPCGLRMIDDLALTLLLLRHLNCMT